MALLFLGSNLGFTLTTHYCMGKAVKSQWQLMPKGLDCGMSRIAATPAEKCDIDLLESSSCCDTEYETVKIKDSFQKATTLLLEVPAAILPFFYLHYQAATPKLRPQAAYAFPPLYSLPPPLKPSLHVLFQVFQV